MTTNRIQLWFAAVLLAIASAAQADTDAKPLAVCATVPELGSLVREVGGDRVAVDVLTKPAEDPHLTPVRPSLVKSLNGCDMLVEVGMELEGGWLPLLVKSAHNDYVLAGGPGFLDASIGVTRLEVPTSAGDRAEGDMHPLGNPHYLTDPMNGMLVAVSIHDKLVALRPSSRPYFDERLASFRRRITVALVGETLAKKYDLEKLTQLAEHGKLVEFLRTQGDDKALGGWLGLLAPDYGAKVVDDHAMWPYFAKRFGLVVAGHLEPKPGTTPTTKHLADIVALAKSEGIRVVLAGAYYDPRHAAFVADRTGDHVLAMANQAGSRPGTDEYLGFVDYNVRQVAEGLKP